MEQPIAVEIWSDVVCPWCYIGKHRFEQALAELDGQPPVEITYRAFQLDPTASPGRTEPVSESYARKFGGPEQAQMMIDRVTSVAADDGLELRLDRALRANTLLAHRLIWRAGQPDSPVTQAAVQERLMRAYFHDGLDIGDPEVLARCAAEVGLDADEVARFLDSGEGGDEVAGEIAEAAELGITAVPTFVIDRTWAVPGAQDAATFAQVLRRIGEKRAAGNGDG
jgi:predicted DsbA family dithiol-disulfide isomerase